MNSLPPDSPQPDSEPASAPFRISPSVYFRYAFAGRKVATVIGVCIAIVATLIAVAAISGDFRYLLLALMAIFIGVPAAMSFVWFSIALSPEAARSTLLHTVTFRSDGSLLLRWIPDESADDDGNAETIAVGSHIPDPALVPSCRIVNRRLSRSHLIFRLSTGELVIVPLDMINLNCQEICQFEDFA